MVAPLDNVAKGPGSTRTGAAWKPELSTAVTNLVNGQEEYFMAVDELLDVCVSSLNYVRKKEEAKRMFAGQAGYISAGTMLDDEEEEEEGGEGGGVVRGAAAPRTAARRG